MQYLIFNCKRVCFSCALRVHTEMMSSVWRMLRTRPQISSSLISSGARLLAGTAASDATGSRSWPSTAINYPFRDREDEHRQKFICERT